MTVRVLLFARARDLAGLGETFVDLAPGTTVADLRQLLVAEFPALAALLPRCAVAVDEEFAHEGQVLSADQTVALLPPVSGGSEAP